VQKNAPENANAAKLRADMTLILTTTTLASTTYAANYFLPANIQPVSQTVLQAIVPSTTIPTRIKNRIATNLAITDELEEVMAYPTLNFPMYKPLQDISESSVVPGLENIPNNSITFLQPNRKFIEAYMVGLNHAFAQMLLFNEFPTDQRGSYFRQFWDSTKNTSYQMNVNTTAQTAAIESSYDINVITNWLGNNLGLNPSPTSSFASASDVILCIRGDLLKRYPNTNIYAVPATSPGVPDLNDAKNTKFPVMTAFFEPDITFLGFDITKSMASQYFFVFEQPTHEPQYGLEPSIVSNTNAPTNYCDLSWANIQTSNNPQTFLQPGGYLDPTKQSIFSYTVSTPLWSPSINSAQMAAVLMRRPFRLCVIGQEMLPQ